MLEIVMMKRIITTILMIIPFYAISLNADVDTVAFWAKAKELFKKNGYDENSDFYKHADENYKRVVTMRENQGSARSAVGAAATTGLLGGLAGSKSESRSKVKKSEKAKTKKESAQKTKKHDVKKKQKKEKTAQEKKAEQRKAREQKERAKERTRKKETAEERRERLKKAAKKRTTRS